VNSANDPAHRFAPGLLPQGHPRAAHPLTAATLTPEALAAALVTLEAAAPELLHTEILGRSTEDRPVRRVTCGTGPLRVLLWSQMHGDEPTATLALLDLLHMLADPAHAPVWTKTILANATLVLVPMLNPDGAARYRRYNAAGIDVNRDARRRASREAELLARLHAHVRPQVAFNLHDQEVRTAGETPTLAALALLAPPPDEGRTMTPERAHAVLLAGRIARAVDACAPGRVARYDDTYEPRAFGDTIQAAGTSTVLVESGHWPGDPLKETVRRLTLVALCAALLGAVREDLGEPDATAYTALPLNGRRGYDLLLRGLQVQTAGGLRFTADAGFVRQGALHDGKLVLREVGDLDGFTAVEEVRVDGATVGPADLAVDASYTRAEIERIVPGRGVAADGGGALRPLP